MKALLRSAAALAAALPAGCFPHRPEAAVEEGPLSTAELIAEVASVRPGDPFAVGVRISLAEGWHTYWRDPGDSGMAPIFEWHLPRGFAVGPVSWPPPRKLEQPPIVNYVYDEEVLLVTELTPPSGLSTSQPVRLRCDFSWLICKDMCVALNDSLELSLPVSRTPPSPSQWRAQFEAAGRGAERDRHDDPAGGSLPGR